MDIYLSLCLSAFLFVSPARIIIRVLHEADEDIEKQLRMRMCVCATVRVCFFSHFLDFITFTFYDLFAEIAYFPFRRREKAKRKFGVLLLVPLFSLSCYCCS